MSSNRDGKGILSTEEQKAIEALASAFAKKTVQPMLSPAAGPDGDLSKVAAVLAEGARIGLLAEHGDGRPGAEMGIWGKVTLSIGPGLSVGLLKHISEACGGIGACFHAAGLGSLAADLFGLTGNGRLACIISDFDDFHVMPCLSSAETAFKRATIKGEWKGTSLVIEGSKKFQLQACQTASYVLIVPSRSGNTYTWVATIIPASDDRLKTSKVKGQMGMRAVEINTIEIDNISIDKQYVASDDNNNYVQLMYAYNLVGMTAVLTGIARGAIASAFSYARERYQGGDLIIRHPAIRLLIAESEMQVIAIESMLDGIAGHTPNDTPQGLVPYAAALKWIGSRGCVQAITDCLQVFGGYGYMEDYGMEKRLRDGQTLKSMAGPSVTHQHTVMDAREAWS